MLHDAIAFWPAALQAAPGPLTLEWALLLALVAAALTPAFAWWLDGPRMAVVTGFMAVLIFIRHHANIGRILAGTEPRIGRKG